jgi:RNA polymerase sigma-70 factor (ECF subfamily)
MTSDAIVASPGPRNRQKFQRVFHTRLSNQIEESRMGDTDEEKLWVTQSQQGDVAAFELLIRNHQRMVHSLTFRMTGSMADAEDLAQETFIRAYHHIGSYRTGAKFSTWLYRIAVNTCLNWRQRETRRAEVQATWAEINDDKEQQADDSQASGELSRSIQEALLRLPAKQRAAIVLTVYDGLNHAEAARVLGCSETTVSWRVFAARRKLKLRLAAGRQGR